jgi:hypothetical protein
MAPARDGHGCRAYQGPWRARRGRAAARTVIKERATGLAEVAAERAKGLAEVDTRWVELHREIAAMHTHQEAHEGRVELNIGGHRFETSVQTLRRVPHTFFDAYFSGRYAQDVFADGSIFVDRDGAHFGHILEYMRDGIVSVAELDVRPSVTLLRALKREFGFYCIELYAEHLTEPTQPEIAFVMGGEDSTERTLRSMERYDALSGQWSVAASMGTARAFFGACVIEGELYVCGGQNDEDGMLRSVEKYSSTTNTWSDAAALPTARSRHAVVASGLNMYALGGFYYGNHPTASVLKFDSVLGTWTEVAPMPHAIYGCAACVVGSDIYVFGGNTTRRYFVSVFKYDTMNNTWSVLAPMPSASMYHSASVLDGLVYIVGAKPASTEVLQYDPAAGTWSTPAPVLIGKFIGASFVLSGNLYAAGGSCNNAAVERYDAATDTWTMVANVLEGRLGFCSVTIRSAGSAEEENLFDKLIATANIRTHQ